jgi:hypothetical protein
MGYITRREGGKPRLIALLWENAAAVDQAARSSVPIRLARVAHWGRHPLKVDQRVASMPESGTANSARKPLSDGQAVSKLFLDNNSQLQ